MTYKLKPLPEKLDEFQNLEYVSDTNKELVTEFVKYLQADDNIGDQRIYKYIGEFKVILRDYIDFHLDEATKKDMRDAVAEIRSTDKSPHTQRDYLITLKKFYRTLWEDEFDRPKRIKKILNASFMKSPEPNGRKKQYNALEPEEAMAMSEEANNPRDALIPVFMFEVGARIGEVLGLRGAEGIRLKDVELKQTHADVTVEALKKNQVGKLPERTLPLTRCVGLLQNWLEQHPRQGESEAHLFVNLGSGKGVSRGDPMGEKNFNKVLKKLAYKADLDKRVNPHAWRHAAATWKGRKFSAAKLKWWFAWSKLETARNYLHENEKRMREQHFKEEGIEEEENTVEAYERKECGRCGNSEPPTASFCSQCSLALDSKAAESQKELESSSGDLVKAEMEGISDEVIKEIKESVLEEMQDG